MSRQKPEEITFLEKKECASGEVVEREEVIA
jgi:hypothetical protein